MKSWKRREALQSEDRSQKMSKLLSSSTFHHVRHSLPAKSSSLSPVDPLLSAGRENVQISLLASLAHLLAGSQPGKSVAVRISESPRGRAGQGGARAGGWVCRERQAPASLSRVAGAGWG